MVIAVRFELTPTNRPVCSNSESLNPIAHFGTLEVGRHHTFMHALFMSTTDYVQYGVFGLTIATTTLHYQPPHEILIHIH